jgi:hypothetical protein
VVVKCALRNFTFDKNENVKQHLNERFYKLNYLIFLIKKMWFETNHLHGFREENDNVVELTKGSECGGHSKGKRLVFLF